MFPEQTESLRNLLNKTAANLFNIQAQNRFTKVPIDFQPSELNPRAAGTYDNLSNRIMINQDDPDPFDRNLQRTMAHEGIHSLLGNTNFIPYVTNRPSTPEAKQLNNKVLYMFSQAGIPMPAGEAPAYLGVGNLRFTPDLTYAEANQWMKNFSEKLSPETKQMLNRMMTNFQKSSRYKGWPEELVKPESK
jgi:hypothetical protein